MASDDVAVISATRTMSRTTSLDGNPELLSREDTRLLRSLCQAMRNADFKKSGEDSWMTTAMPPVPTGSNVSQAISDVRGNQQPRGLTSDNTSLKDSSVSPESADDREADTGGGVRSDTPAPETEKPVSDTKDEREDKKKSVSVQTTAAPSADAVVTSRPSVDAGGAVGKKNKLEEDIHQQLYKGFKGVNDRLPLLESAISRVGGVGDVLSSIRRLRAALLRALYWDDNAYFRDKYRKGQLNSLEKVLAFVRFWPDLKEDGTVFQSGTQFGKPIATVSDMELLLERIWLSALVMLHAFNDLGSVNGCQFVSLCSTLRAVKEEIYVVLQGIHRSESDMERLFQKLPKLMFTLSAEISKAIERDIPNLRTAEQQLTDKYTSMSTTATFFSSITITALQLSSPMTGNKLKDAVNTVWFTSLVFSIGSVIVSLLGLSWFKSQIPMGAWKEKKLKKRVVFLLLNGPVMLMTAAAATFMLGLALFVNSSGQARSTSIVTSSFIAFISIVLIFLAIYFAILSGAATKLWRNVTRFLRLPRRKAVLQADSATEDSDEDDNDDSGEIKSNHSGKALLAEPERGLTPSDAGKTQLCLGAVDGPLAVINSETSLLQIYKTFNDTTPISDKTVSPPLQEVKELLWSPDKKNLLFRTGSSLSIWSEENNDLRAIPKSSDTIDSDPIKVAIWTSNSNILTIHSKSFIHIDRDIGDAGDPKNIPDHISVISAQRLDDERLVCIADDNNNANPVRKLLVMNHTTGYILYEGKEIQKTSYSLQLSEGEGLTKVLLSFADGSMPQLWHLRQHNLTSWEVKLKLIYKFGNDPCKCPASFAGRGNKLVVFSVSKMHDAKAENILIWSADDATLKQSIDITEITSISGFSSCISWKVDDSDTPTTLALAVACNNGMVVKGKINFSDSIADQIVLHESDVQVVNI